LRHPGKPLQEASAIERRGIRRAGADGSVAARAGTAVDCRKHHWTNQVVRLTGHATGGHFTATGHTSLSGGHRLRVKLTGTIAGAVVSGRYVERLKG
jgi:hypothetical protein